MAPAFPHPRAPSTDDTAVVPAGAEQPRPPAGRALEGAVVPVDRRVLAVAARQHGVVSTAQLGRCGATRHHVAHRLATGWLTRIHRGVYLVGPLETPHSRPLAAVLATPR